MTSDDYKDRFRAEYQQTKIRYDKLHKMLIKYDAGTLPFEPVNACSEIRLLQWGAIFTFLKQELKSKKMISDRPRLGRFLYARFTPSVAYGASSLNEGAF